MNEHAYSFHPPSTEQPQWLRNYTLYSTKIYSIIYMYICIHVLHEHTCLPRRAALESSPEALSNCLSSWFSFSSWPSFTCNSRISLWSRRSRDSSTEGEVEGEGEGEEAIEEGVGEEWVVEGWECGAGADGPCEDDLDFSHPDNDSSPIIYA